MKKVNFVYSNGRERMMKKRDADILSKLKRGTYMTADMRSQSMVTSSTTDFIDDYDSLTIDELKVIASEREINIHHRAGKEKIISALRETEQ